jgi:hypothetical protein
MEPCGPTLRRCPIVRRGALRFLILCAAFAASIGILSPNAWATPAATTTSLTITSAGSDVTSVASGTVITLTATVVSGSTPVNPGQVKFCDASAAHCEDSALLATAQLTPAGTATYKFRPGIGGHSYEAVFIGTTSYAKSGSTSASLSVTGLPLTSTTLTASGSVGSYTLTATVLGFGNHAFTPTGEMSFLDMTNGSASLGSAPLEGTSLGSIFPMASTSSISLPALAALIVLGDFNGDGIPDLATAYEDQPGTVAILLGKGDGTFARKSTLNVGPNFSSAVAVGDFNGDGFLDLAVTSDPQGVPGTVAVFLGHGDGTFTTGESISVGVVPSDLLVADFNGDGIPDLAVTNLDNTVTVLLGNGDGTFATTSSPAVGMLPYAVVAGDFNGDGILDLATANCGDGCGNNIDDGTVTVLLGNGDGTFTNKSTPSVGSTPQSIMLGDFNGDGLPDVAVVNQGSNTVTVLLSNGDGTFTIGSTPAVGNHPTWLAVSDFNGDGIADLAVLNQADDTVTILQGKGDGTFTTQSSPGAGYGPNRIVAEDLNGDGLADLLISDFGKSLTVLLNAVTATAKLSGVSVSGVEIHKTVASYPGDTNFNPSISSPVTLLSAQVQTTLTLSSSVNGSLVTLTATLSPYSMADLTTNGEYINFNTPDRGSYAQLVNGVATVTSVSPLSGSYSAAYAGDVNFTAATSNTIRQVGEPQAATPTFSRAGGLYFAPQTVMMSDSTPGAMIYYTTNGTAPTTSSTPYTGTITVSSTETVLAIAVAPNYSQSFVARTAYTIAPTAAQPLISPPTGTYTSTQSVTITDTTPGAVIYYTTDGTTPNRSSPVFSGTPFTVNSSQTVKALAVAPNDATSPEGVAIYNIIPPYAATPTFNLPPGFYHTAQMVGLSDVTPGAKIYYTTDHTVPTTSSTLYTGSSIPIDITTQVKAIAVAPGYSNSPVAVGDFYVSAAQPIITPRSGSYTGPQMVMITDATPGAVIYYTTDGATPDRSSAGYSSASPIMVTSSQTIKALAVAPSYTTRPRRRSRLQHHSIAAGSLAELFPQSAKIEIETQKPATRRASVSRWKEPGSTENYAAKSFVFY